MSKLRKGQVGSRSINKALEAIKAEAIEGATPEPGVAVADATDSADIVEQFNALLASLRGAGFIGTE